jgi:hypothetical protein
VFGSKAVKKAVKKVVMKALMKARMNRGQSQLHLASVLALRRTVGAGL